MVDLALRQSVHTPASEEKNEINIRRVLPILIIASIMLSLIPSNYFALALQSPTLSATYGSMGKTIKVTGPAGAVPASKTVQLYWETSTGVWDGVRGLMNSTTAKANGSYEVWFKVPEATNGAHKIWVKDADGNTASTDLTVETRNENHPNAGLPGDTIESNFYGFHSSKDLAIILSSVNPPTSTKVTDEILASPNGTATEFKGTFAKKYIVPNSIHFRASGDQYARDDGGGNIVGYSEEPTVNGTINYITGEYDIIFFTAPPAKQNGLGTDYSYWGTSSTAGSTQFDLGKGATNSMGSAFVSWKVPGNVTYLETYKLISFDSLGLWNGVSFKIMGIKLSSNSGPTGKTITIHGEGLTPDETWMAAINAPAIGERIIFEGGEIDSDGKLLGGDDILIPGDLTPGTYMITAWDSEDYFEPGAQFTVTYGTSITVTPDGAPNNYNVTISGKGFSYLATGPADLSFTLYNKTSTGAADQVWNMNVEQNWPVGGPYAATVNGSGMVRAYWIVPDSATIGIGTYHINATDVDDYLGQIIFNVIAPHIVALPRNATFSIGDTISFQLEDTYKTAPVDGSVIKIYDPSGSLVFTSDTLNAEKWIKTGLWYTIPDSTQRASGKPMIIPENAPTGTWSYKWIGTDTKDIANGTFAVKPKIIPPGSLKVNVKDSNGNAISGATISSSKQPSGQTALSGVTGADGSVTFTELIIGNYTLQVSKSGYSSGSAQGAIASGAKTELSAALQTQPASGGIPGFPFESVFIGLALVVLTLFVYRKNQTRYCTRHL